MDYLRGIVQNVSDAAQSVAKRVSGLAEDSLGGAKATAHMVSRRAEMSRGRRDIGYISSIFGDTITIRATQPFDIDIAGLISSYGVSNVRSVILDIENPLDAPVDPDNNIPIIAGRSNITYPSTGNIQVQLSIGANNDTVAGGGHVVEGFALVNHDDSDIFSMPYIDIIGGVDGFAISNTGQSIAPFDDYDNVIEVTGVDFSNSAAANSIYKAFGIYPNIPAAIGQAPYQQSFSLPSYFSSTTSFYADGDDGFVAFVLDDGTLGFSEEIPGIYSNQTVSFPRILKLSFNERGILKPYLTESVFDSRNTGPNSVATDSSGFIILSPQIPQNGSALAAGESLNIAFQTDVTADGNVAIAIAYKRFTNAGTRYRAPEFAAAIEVLNNGTLVSSFREGLFTPGLIAKSSMDTRAYTISSMGTANDGDDVFVGFAKNGAPQSVGHLVNGTQIESAPLSDYNNLQHIERRVIGVKDSSVAISGGDLLITSFNISDAEKTHISNSIAYIVDDGSNIAASVQNGGTGYVLIPPNIENATITFAASGDYILVNQSNVNLVFPAIDRNFTGDLEEIEVEGIVSTVAHFPNGTNITFYGEGIDYIRDVVINPLVAQVTDAPTLSPTSVPSSQPSFEPTSVPSPAPSSDPTSVPTPLPSEEPTAAPSFEPTAAPSPEPSESPTPVPSSAPSEEPTPMPSELPTSAPSKEPTPAPSELPSASPTSDPSESPTPSPSWSPTAEPTQSPSWSPTAAPTPLPSASPSSDPTLAPSAYPTGAPISFAPSAVPTSGPTNTPSALPTSGPTSVPSYYPTATPTKVPTIEGGKGGSVPVGTAVGIAAGVLGFFALMFAAFKKSKKNSSGRVTPAIEMSEMDPLRGDSLDSRDGEIQETVIADRGRDTSSSQDASSSQDPLSSRETLVSSRGNSPEPQDASSPRSDSPIPRRVSPAGGSGERPKPPSFLPPLQGGAAARLQKAAEKGNTEPPSK